MKSNHPKKVVILAVALFIIGVFIGITIITNPEMFTKKFEYRYSTDINGDTTDVYEHSIVVFGHTTDTYKHNTDIYGQDSFDFVVKLLGYSFIATSLLYTIIIFYKYSSQ